VTGATGTVQLLVKRGKRIEGAVVVRVVDGEVAGAEAGEVPEPDVTLSLTPDDATAFGAGTLDLTVAFMRGTMKVAGDNRVLLQVLPLADSEAFDPARRALALR
jgi:putative sterol carrier protein